MVPGVTLPLTLVALSSQVSYCLSLLWLCVIPDVSLLLTRVPPCHSRYFTATHWVFGVPYVPLLFPKLVLHHLRCTTAIHSDDFVSSQLSHLHSYRLFHFIPGVPLSITGVTLYHLRCPTFAYWGGSAWSQQSHFCSLVLFYVFPGALLPLMWMFQHHCNCPCCSLGWHCIISGFSLMLTGVLPCDPQFHSATKVCGSVSSQKFYCLSRKCLPVVKGVFLPVIGGGGISTLSQVFHFHSLRWFHVIPGVPLLFPQVARVI